MIEDALNNILEEATIEFNTRWKSDEIQANKNKWNNLHNLYQKSQELEYPYDYRAYTWFRDMMTVKYNFTKYWTKWHTSEPKPHQATEYQKQLEQVFIDHISHSVSETMTIQKLKHYTCVKNELGHSPEYIPLFDFFNDTIVPVCRKLSKLENWNTRVEPSEDNPPSYNFDTGVATIPDGNKIYTELATEIQQEAFRNSPLELFKIALEVNTTASAIQKVDADIQTKRTIRKLQKRLEDYKNNHLIITDHTKQIEATEDEIQQLETIPTPDKRKKAIVSAMDNLLKASGLKQRLNIPDRESTLARLQAKDEPDTKKIELLKKNLHRYNELKDTFHYTEEIQTELIQIEEEYLSMIDTKTVDRDLEKIRKNFIEFLSIKDRSYTLIN